MFSQILRRECRVTNHETQQTTYVTRETQQVSQPRFLSRVSKTFSVSVGVGSKYSTHFSQKAYDCVRCRDPQTKTGEQHNNGKTRRGGEKALFFFANREIQTKKRIVSRETFAFLCCVIKTAKNIHSKASNQAIYGL